MCSKDGAGRCGNILLGLSVFSGSKRKVLGSSVYWLVIEVFKNLFYFSYFTDSEYVKNQSPEEFVTVHINPFLLEIFKVRE